MQEEYNLKENNCEHLVTIATIGFPLSIQVHHAIHQALQCSKAIARSCRGSFMNHAGTCSTADAPLHTVCHTQHYLVDMAVQGGSSKVSSHVSSVIASKSGVIATKVGTNVAAKSATKASVKTTSKAAFEAGSEAAISGTLLGAIGGIAFGVNLLLEAPFYIRGAYKLHRKKKFDIISKEEYKREMIRISLTSVNTVVGGTVGAVAGQAAIPVPVLGAVVGGLVGSLAGQACGYFEGKAIGCMIRNPAQITLPILHIPQYIEVKKLEEQLERKCLCPYKNEEDGDTKQSQSIWHTALQ